MQFQSKILPRMCKSDVNTDFNDKEHECQLVNGKTRSNSILSNAIGAHVEVKAQTELHIYLNSGTREQIFKVRKWRVSSATATPYKQN